MQRKVEKPERVALAVVDSSCRSLVSLGHQIRCGCHYILAVTPRALGTSRLSPQIKGLRGSGLRGSALKLTISHSQKFRGVASSRREIGFDSRRADLLGQVLQILDALREIQAERAKVKRQKVKRTDSGQDGGTAARHPAGRSAVSISHSQPFFESPAEPLGRLLYQRESTSHVPVVRLAFYLLDLLDDLVQPVQIKHHRLGIIRLRQGAFAGDEKIDDFCEPKPAHGPPSCPPGSNSDSANVSLLLSYDHRRHEAPIHSDR
jgi:hypothetical protein